MSPLSMVPSGRAMQRWPLLMGFLSWGKIRILTGENYTYFLVFINHASMDVHTFNYFGRSTYAISEWKWNTALPIGNAYKNIFIKYNCTLKSQWLVRILYVCMFDATCSRFFAPHLLDELAPKSMHGFWHVKTIVYWLKRVFLAIVKDKFERSLRMSILSCHISSLLRQYADQKIQKALKIANNPREEIFSIHN